MKINRILILSKHHIYGRTLLMVGVTWLPLLFLTIAEGALLTGVDVPFLKDIVPYARCLIVIPLLISVESVIAPMIANVDEYLKTSGIVPVSDLPELTGFIEKRSVMMNALLVNLLLLLVSITASWFMKADYTELLELKNLSSWALYSEDGVIESSMSGMWFIYVSLPLVSFILYRWLWRFIVWSLFLYRISRLDLQLQATHSDLSGGLGIVGIAHNMFGVLFLAMSMMTSAQLANELLYEGAQFVDVKLFVIVYLVMSIVFINAPLLVFSRSLFKLKRQAILEYSLLQYQTSAEFHQHWITRKNSNMVDSVQPSAVADYSAVYETISSIRMMPLNPRGVAVMSAIILAPFLPLVFTQSSIKDVILTIGGSVL